MRTARDKEQPDNDRAVPQAVTLTGSVYERMRAEVLSGKLRPGEKLSAAELRQRFHTGSSPVREALNRLLSEGFVSLVENKGFRVAAVSQEELRELLLARGWVDGLALSESIKNFDRTWEEAVVLALHRLSKVSRVHAEQRVEWERLHKAFHMTLVSGCGSRWMMRTVEQLFDAWERYRLLATGCLSERNELEVHRGIVDACFERNPARAVELLKHHYGATYEKVVNHFVMPERAEQ